MAVATSAMTGLGRVSERLSPWYDADYVLVCVSVWLCVFSRVQGASCVGRPTCVCAVWAPLRRVKIKETKSLQVKNKAFSTLPRTRYIRGAREACVRL